MPIAGVLSKLVHFLPSNQFSSSQGNNLDLVVCAHVSDTDNIYQRCHTCVCLRALSSELSAYLHTPPKGLGTQTRTFSALNYNISESQQSKSRLSGNSNMSDVWLKLTCSFPTRMGCRCVPSTDLARVLRTEVDKVIISAVVSDRHTLSQFPHPDFPTDFRKQ